MSQHPWFDNDMTRPVRVIAPGEHRLRSGQRVIDLASVTIRQWCIVAALALMAVIGMGIASAVAQADYRAHRPVPAGCHQLGQGSQAVYACTLRGQIVFYDSVAEIP